MRNPIVFLFFFGVLGFNSDAAETPPRPNIVLMMADDQGWGETGYNGHPILKTPELDAMAAVGLRLNRFYAGAPVCSPTRAAVLTGRSCYRVGVPEHGYALRHQEITLPALLANSGYQTAHFGKWHLNGLRGPGVPIFRDDPFRPDRFGFQHWLSVTNFFDRDPILGRSGSPGNRGAGFEDYQGDSSDVIVQQAVKHITEQAKNDAPFFTVVWFGTPHSPFKASKADRAAFDDLNESSRHHYGELVALDRSVGALRTALRKLDIADETLVWYCSDNGGLNKITPPTVGGLRGHKGLIYEGGLRVPGIIEWPKKISPRQSSFPASVMDMMPTILELAGVSYPDDRPTDGISLTSLFKPSSDQDPTRESPICFRYKTKAAIVDNEWKLLTEKVSSKRFQLYHLSDDPAETNDVSDQFPVQAEKLRDQLTTWLASTDASESGADYQSGRVDADHPAPQPWTQRADYQPFFEQWKSRWEYTGWLERNLKAK